MTVLDLNNASTPVPPNQNPTVNVIGASPQFNLAMAAGDEQIICLESYASNYSSASVQTTAAGDAIVGQSTAACFVLAADNPCNCPDDFIFNPSASFANCGAMPSNFEMINLAGFSGIKITAINNTSVTITLGQEAITGTCYATPAGCCPSTDAILSDILAELKDDQDREILWAEDVNNPGNYVRYVETVDQDSGSISVSCIDSTGATVACPTNLKPITGKQIKFAELCQEVVNPGGWGSAGDIITKIVCYDVTGALPVLMGVVWFNQSQNQDITPTPPAAADVQACNQAQVLPIVDCGNANGVDLGGTLEGKTLEAIVLCDAASNCTYLQSSTPGFSFPYVYTDFAQAETDLNAWLAANGGGTATLSFDGSVPAITLLFQNTVFVDGKWATDGGGQRFGQTPSSGQQSLLVSLSDCTLAELENQKCCFDGEIEQLVHYDPTTKACTDMVRKWVFDKSAATWSFSDFDHADNPFTVTGDVFHTPQRYNLGGESLNFTDGAIITPASVPAGADVAEVAVWGGAIVYEKDQTMPNPTPTAGFHRIMDGGVFELEGRDEILALKIIGQVGMSGKVEIRYKKGLKVNN